jgi:mannose-6-phosphate isomerase-like protein (cupin superfamily)
VTISKYRREAEFPTAERCYIVELHNRADDEGCSIARARVPPGVTTQLHAVHGTIERYVILEGAGRVEVEGEPAATVGPLDVVTIRAGAAQRITNTGRADLLFLCVCTPRFRQDNYVTRE